MSKHEIEKELEKKGKFVQISYLTNFLKEELTFETKKFVFFKLANLYESIGMFKDAARMYHNIALISIIFTEKIKNHMKEAELFLRTGDFEKVNEAIKKALNQGNASEKAEIFFNLKTMYKNQAEIFEKSLKRNQARKIYERLLEFNISESEKIEIKKKLLPLYEKLGKLKEYFILKKSLNDNI